jgi:hypothetical protein
MHMYKLQLSTTLILLLMISAVACKNSDNAPQAPMQCKQLHTGEFSYYAPTKTGEIPFRIWRTDSTQLEVSGIDSTFFKITWTDDCHYELLLLRSTFRISTEQLNITKTYPMLNSIDYIGDSFYKFTAEREANEFLLEDTMYIK